MSSSQPARKRLPVKPSEENLRKQAKRRAKLEGTQLAEAQHRLAHEYGCHNWAELMHVVEVMNRGADQLAFVQRKVEPLPASVRTRDVAKVREILSSGQFTQHDLDAGLAHAAWYGGDDSVVLKTRRALFDLLLDHGADPDGQYGSAYGPIIFGTGECLDPHGLQWLIDAGADVTFSPVETKYGRQCALSYWLGTYVRGRNETKHRGIQILLEHGAFLPPEVAPPILAIHRGDAELLGDLIDRDRSLLTRPFAEMPYGNIPLAGATLLHCAVEFGEIECLNALLNHHADINIKADVLDGIGGQTPIFHAINTCGDGNFYTLEYLVQRVGQSIDMSVKATWRGSDAVPLTPLEYSEKAQREIDPKRARYRPRVNDEITLLRSLDRRGKIRQACEGGDLLNVSRMLDESGELASPELWPAVIFRARSLDLTRLLLDRGLSPDECPAPRKPLHLAVYQCLPDIVELLLERGADPNQLNPLGERPIDLLDAYEPRPIGDPDAQRIRAAMLQAGATEDVHSAVRAGDLNGVRQMLDADPSLLESQAPWPPLFSAARSGRAEMARLLLACGADVNARNDKGNTALWFACQSSAPAEDRIAVAKVLIEAGAHVRDACEDGSTALHFAAWRGPVAMVELLIRHGAKEWQQDHQGKKPVDYARGNGVSADKGAIIELLDRPVIRDPLFKQAVIALQTGDLAGLQRLLADHPHLTRDRAREPDCYGADYFRDPKLLWFVANNPALVEIMPVSSVAIAEAIIDARVEQSDLDYTLGLVMTSGPAREQKFQRPLMKLLLDRGAEVKSDDLFSTLGHCERDAVVALLESGLPLTAPVAAGLGRVKDLTTLLEAADDAEKHAALSMAVINREVEAARLCLAAGADVNAFLLVHRHSLPIHQAAVNDDVPMLRLLVEHGARLDIRDTLWNATPLGWAIHTKKPAAEAYLRTAGS